MSSSPSLFNVIVKVTTDCSLACRYCYVRPHHSTLGHTTLSLSLIEKLLRDYLDLLRFGSGADTDGRALKLTWHGGEPLLAGLEYFKEVVALERRVVPPPFRVVNAITTNGVGLNEAWISFLRENRFQIGISLDGPRDIHDSNRISASGAGSFDSVMTAIRALQASGVPFGILAVVSAEAAGRPDDVFEFFSREGIKNINFIPFTSLAQRLPPVLFTHFLTRVFDLWLSLDDPEVYIREFANLLARIFGQAANLCEYSNCFGNYLGIDPRGDVYMCDLLIGSPDFLLGSLETASLEALLRSDRYERLQALARTKAPQCQRCEVLEVCSGGCMYRRYLRNHVLPGRDLYCSTRRTLINHIVQSLGVLERTRAADRGGGWGGGQDIGRLA